MQWPACALQCHTLIHTPSHVLSIVARTKHSWFATVPRCSCATLHASTQILPPWESLHADALNVVCVLTRLVLIAQVLHHLLCVRELVQAQAALSVGEVLEVLVVLAEGLSLLLGPHELLVVAQDLVEQVPDGGVVGQHEARHAVRALDVGALLGQRHLDGRGPPLDEVGRLALPDALQALVHLRGVHIALDDVEDGDVAAVLTVALARVLRHHDVLGLQQAAHDVQHGCLADVGRHRVVHVCGE
mmetsp:Transcript_14394/g.35705  ORF Transcript_14394/g.35705 Transcript_14394/m.35705 type:complete len:245 (-) Transcript_14394:1041-1775(-)